MIASIQPSGLKGTIQAIPSKSEAHRALICAALSFKPSKIEMDFTSEDIEATIRCLEAFGAGFERNGSSLCVTPVSVVPAACVADCGESGSTLRFLLPVAAALGIDTTFVMHGRLPSRPMTPLEDALIAGGCSIDRPSYDRMRVSGKLRAGTYTLPGNVSSQFITGMLFALSVTDGISELKITKPIESKDYILITLRTMSRFGVNPMETEDGYRITGTGRFNGIEEISIGGDWSNAAFWMAAGVEVTGLETDSAQGDRAIAALIREFEHTDGLCVVDASSIPDLVPAIAAYACVNRKLMSIENAQRLRLKESDRIKSVVGTICALGGFAGETEDGMLIDGTSPLRGGSVDAQGDHRIAMMAAILSTVCAEPVTISNAEAVRKSYPEFWKDFALLGGCVELKEG